ncbi:MAG TPA: flagellum-specific ATP synthase FliI, partial [Gammaproteobacteria bacterium]|nr:flagellum-specific ATP synthase FliI [Gammaproteobacteria bacterium]
HSGSITAIYTVLAEGDNQNDPIVDSARAVLDGHIVLSRRIAEKGQFPAIDIEASISRLMNTLASPEHRQWASQFRKILSQYHQNEDLINTGIYQPGSNPELDHAIRVYPQLIQYLRQDIHEVADFAPSLSRLQAVIELNPVTP